MCFLCLLSSSRWPGGYPARCSEECTDKLRSGSYIPLNPLSASPIFVTVFVALRIHKKDFCWQTFFFGGGGYFWGFFFQRLQWRQSVGLKTTDLKKQNMPSPSAGRRERLLKLAEYRWTRLHNMCWATLSVWDKYLCFVLLFFCPKDDSIFLERLSSPWFVLFGAPPSNRPLWRNSLQERRKKLKRNLKWLKDNQELRHQVNQLWILYWHGGQGVSI